MAAPKPDESTLFNAARQIDDPEARRLYVRAACGEDLVLAGRVEALLRAHDEGPTFLASPTKELGDFLGALNEAPTLVPEPAPGADGPPPLRSAPAGYEILGELGRGGMGVVYKARQAGLNRLVALKMVLAGSHAGPDELARFRTEAEAVAALQHPNIVQIHEVGERDGLPYFSLELVEGGSLADRLDGTPWPARAAAELVAALARATHYAHSRGVIHRDLKPANVLLAACGLAPNAKPQAATPKITDFGLAKQIDGAAGRTRTGTVMGTPSYMAPEQAGGQSKEIGPACDTYALGAILYELLTGRPPFRAETPLDTILQVIGNEPVPPRRLVPQVPRDLETICLKCLQKSPAKRYATAGALADDLQRFLDSQPIQARPTPAWERLAKWVRRRPAVAALTLLSAVTAAVGFALVTWQWREADAARTRAEGARTGEERQRRQAEDALREAQVNLYFNHIALADGEWHAGNPDRAEELLDACPAELREWEWGYLKRLCHSDLLTVGPPVMGFSGIAYSPDGKYLATAGLGTDLLLLDAAGGEVVRTLRGHSNPVVAVAFSPDGRRLASGGYDEDEGKGELKVWDVADGREVFTAPGNQGGVTALAFSPDGQRLAVAAGDPMNDKPADVRVFDAATGDVFRTLRGPAGKVNAVAFSPDGHTLVAAGGSPRTLSAAIKVWEADTGKELPSFVGHGRAMTGVIQGGMPLGAFQAMVNSGHGRGVSGLAFSPDSKYLATAGWDQTARVWEVPSRKAVLTYYGHGSALSGVAFSPDGRHVASTGLDRSVHVWDAATGQRTRTLLGHAGAVFGLAYAPDGRRLASVALIRDPPRGELKVWDLTDEQAFRARGAHVALLRGLALSPDGRRLASAGFDGMIRLWDADTFRPLPGAMGMPSSANTVAFSPDGTLLASRVAVGVLKLHGELRLLDVATGNPVRTLCALDPVLRAVAFSPDGRLLAAETGGNVFAIGPGEITVWDLATGQKVVTLRGRSVAFSPDGRRLAFGTDHAVTVHDLAAGRDVLTLEGHTGEVLAVAFDRDGSRIACGSRDRSVRVWDAATGALLGELVGHTAPVSGLAFHPGGRRLASASMDSIRGVRGK